MKSLQLTISIFLLSVFGGSLYSQTLTWNQCNMYNQGAPWNMNYNHTFTSVDLADADVELTVGFLACSPNAVNGAGIQLNGSTWVESNTPSGNCGYVYTTYYIDQAVFNQAVIDGNGDITFSWYTDDNCMPGTGCSFYSDPCIDLDITYVPCVPSTPVPDVATLPNLTDECSVSAPTPPTATSCSVLDGTPDVSFPITTPGTTVVTWTYDDGNGNTSTQTQNVIIADVTAPVTDTPTLSDIVTTCGQSVNSLTTPTATDNCAGSIVGTHNASLPITSNTMITWTYDDGNGNTTTQTQNIVINPDVVAPVADAPGLANINTACEVTSIIAPTATDNCAGSIIGTSNVSLPITTQGTTTITWTFDDGNGNSTTQTQDVIISDVAVPVASLANLPDLTDACAVTSLTAPTATDNCAGLITGTHNASLPITAQGTTTVTWTYDDGNGNTATQTQDVIISDVVAPTADLANLSDIAAECEVTSLTPPTATDNCAGSIAGTHNATLPITAQGTTTVTWTYDDGNGNTTTQTQNVVVSDVSAPVADVATLSDITDECEVTPTAPTATDNCTGAITATPDVSFPVTTSGTTTITWTYDDGNGNTSTQTQDVVITPIDVTTTTNLIIDNNYQISANANGYTYQWIEDCGNTNTPVSGATSIDYVPTSNGSYAVIIDNGTCSDTSDCVIIDDLGIHENDFGSSLVIYPNPTAGELTIDLGGTYSNISVEVVDLIGRIVLSKEFTSASSIVLGLEGTPGTYIVNIQTKEGKSARVNVVKKQ